MKRKTVVAVLDTMWGWRSGKAPRLFQINPENHSGKRLYKLVGSNVRLLVTNACRELTTDPNRHGKPDPEWLCENLNRLKKLDLILVCGSVAKKTFKRVKYWPMEAGVVFMPHPAARCWTKKLLVSSGTAIREALED